MEHNWERTLPFLQISNHEIKKLFNGILEEEDITSILPINEGCRTTNYIIKTKKVKNNFILKIFLSTEQNYKKEIKLLNKLKHNIPVQKIYKVDNHPIIKNRQYAIYEYIEGQTIGQAVNRGYVLQEGVVREVAKTLAMIHSYKFEKIGFLDENLNIAKELPPISTWYENFMGERARKRLGEDIVNKIKYVIKKNEKTLNKLDKDSRLVHGDFQGTNILIEDGKLCGILDWEFAMAGHPLADIGQFFRYEEYFNDNLIQVFEDEYNKASDHILINNWYNISKLRDLVNLIQLLDEKEDMPNKYANIKDIILRVLSRF